MEENPDPKPSGTTGNRFLDFNHAPKQGDSLISCIELMVASYFSRLDCKEGRKFL